MNDSSQNRRRRWLFLRSAHKGEEAADPDPVLDMGADMWCALFADIVRADGGIGHIWKLGGPLKVEGPLPTGIHVSRSLEPAGVAEALRPQVIFDRGGYPAYLPALHAAPEAIKVYYGAGERYCPRNGIRYDLILVDTVAQRQEVQRACPESRAIVFHKPAAPIFRPVETAKHYDLVFICNRPAEFKGCKWLADRLPPKISLIKIGPIDKWLDDARRGEARVGFVGRLDRWLIPVMASQASFGIVCDDGRHDSGPRVLPELLGMGIPVIVRATVRSDLEAYVTQETGKIIGKAEGELADAIDGLKDGAGRLRPREVYEEHFSLARAAGRLLKQMGRAGE